VGQRYLYIWLVLIRMVLNDRKKSKKEAFKGYTDAFLYSLYSQGRYSKSTSLAYETDLKQFNKYLKKSLRRIPTLGDFNAHQVARFLDAERLLGRKRSTLIRRRAVLRSLSTYLQKSGYLENDFFSLEAESINIPIASVDPQKNRRVLTPVEIKRLQQAFEASKRPRARRDHAIFTLLLETGIPVGKLVGLEINDLKVKEGHWYLRLPSEQKQWLPISSSTPFMQRYFIEGRPELNPFPDEPALFISQTGNRISRQGVWQVLAFWGNKAGLEVTLSPRLVRNTAAVQFIQKQLPLSEMKNLFGHTNHLSTLAMVRRLNLTIPKNTTKHE
jgi:site-specific recombinase XerD